MAYFLDTNTCIVAITKSQPRLNQRIERAGLAATLSPIVLGELWTGVEKSARRAANELGLLRFIENLSIVDFDATAAQHYAEIRADLERAGTPIGSNDTLIAGHARSLGYTLVTNNRREFDRVPGLKVENWLS